MSEGKTWTIGCSLALIGVLVICGVANLAVSQPAGGQFLFLAAVGVVVLITVLALQSAAVKRREQAQIAHISTTLETEAQHVQTTTAPTSLIPHTPQFTALEAFSDEQADEIIATHTVLGMHPETFDDFVMPDQERFSGMYVLGVQGVGKSSLLECLISLDIVKETSVIVIDPHGDLIEHIIGQMPEEKLAKTTVLDIEDTEYPFGLNLFSIQESATITQQQQAHDRVLHVFEKCFPETSHMLLDKYIGNIAPVFFANANVGYSITDIPKFLRDDAFREQLLASKKVGYFIRSFWQDEYAEMSPSKRQSETASLATRLNRFVRSPIVGNIIGQSKTTIDFRRAIENKEIILIHLPIKTLKEDAELIGTMLIAQIHAAIFSFADVSQERRPGFSLFVDEFQHFATTDFAEMFTEGRKFGSRVCVAHQYRNQLPDYLQSSTMTARTKVCFQAPEDSREMAPLFVSAVTEVKPENIDPEPVNHLLTYGSENSDVQTFITWYLRPIRSMPRKNRMIEVTTWKMNLAVDVAFGAMGYYAKEKPKVADPEPYLNSLLYEVMKTKDDEVNLPAAIVYGFSNCGKGFFQELEIMEAEQKVWYLSPMVHFPNNLVIQTSDHVLHWTLPPKDSFEQLMHFLFFLRRTMLILASNPIGETSKQSAAEIAQQIINLPKRTAFVRSGETVALIETDDTPEMVTPSSLAGRKQQIREQTRQNYCRAAYDVEQEIRQRLEAKELAKEERHENHQTAEENVREQPQQEPELVTKREAEQPQQALLPTSKERLNLVYAQMKAKEIDPDTAILAALGETYVMTIKQWMRLFAWKSYPRATQYFKELREKEYIYRKDREGRGGNLAEGDWFLLLTKGANELTKRKQAEALFTLEPNEADKVSGDTLLHTYLVNELFIHLRLLERDQPQVVTIEEIVHERSMRRRYAIALGADAKFYPDGVLRLLVPTSNGLKRRYMFFEMQHTTQKDKANWQTKVRKYLSLFSKTDTLEKVFRTKAPQVLVITMSEEYAIYHKQWTEEGVISVGDKRQDYASRFIIGTYETGISDMTVSPTQFFCTPRFVTPFTDEPHALFEA